MLCYVEYQEKVLYPQSKVDRFDRLQDAAEFVYDLLESPDCRYVEIWGADGGRWVNLATYERGAHEKLWEESVNWHGWDLCKL